MKVEVDKIIVVLLFVILFSVVGYGAPAVYATYADSSHYIEVHSFTTQNSTVGDTEHDICLNREVKKSNTAVIFVEMFYTSSDGTYIERDATRLHRYFDSGEIAVQTPIDLDPELAPGEYQYTMVVQMELANGDVTREFVYESDSFHVKENGTDVGEDFACPPA